MQACHLNNASRLNLCTLKTSNIANESNNKRGRKPKVGSALTVLILFLQVKNIKFGAVNYGDYIYWTRTEGSQYAMKKREQYLARHKVRESWTIADQLSAGYWSRWILWGPYSNVAKNLAYIKRNNLLTTDSWWTSL